MHTARSLLLLAGLSLASSVASAQWDPQNAQYGKTDARDLRFMTWNVLDELCSTNNFKVEGFNGWTAQARIIAALKPDVLVLQETGDNSGNGSGSSVDSVANLTTTVGLFLRGGNDPFKSNAVVTAYVQKYAPGYDLPYVYVAPSSDNFNRNIILSRYPFADLNGDTRATTSDATIASDLYAPGGSLGIRGFQFAEINLPDASYRGNLVAGTAHMKAGGASGDLAQRLSASQNIAYYIDYLYNGAGGSTPDPRSKIFDSPAATTVLDAYTPIIWGGDFNEDELNNGRKGPVEWMAQAQNTGGTDGTDRDRGDSSYDDSRDIFNSSARKTQGTSSKLDYVMWQDSIAQLRRSFIFNAGTIPAGKYPAELIGYAAPNGEGFASAVASDHLPVIADFILPAPLPPPPSAFTLSVPADGAVDQDLAPTLTWATSTNATTYTVTVATDAALTAVVASAAGLTGTSYAVPAGLLSECETYYWGVTAVNTSGSTSSAVFSFLTNKPTDLNNDGSVDLDDFFAFFGCFDTGDACGDLDGQNGVDLDDFFLFFGGFDTGC